MADTQLALIEAAVIDVVLSREGKRRYSNGDPLTLDPSDLRDIVRLTMAKCAALASRPAEVDGSPVDQACARVRRAEAELKAARKALMDVMTTAARTDE